MRWSRRIDDETDELISSIQFLQHNLNYSYDYLLTKIDGLQKSVKALESSCKTESSETRKLVQLLGEEIKKIEGKPIQITQIVTPVPNICTKCHTTKLAMGGVVLLAVAYGYMSWKGISISDTLDGTRRSIASHLAKMTKHLGQKSVELTDTLWRLTEQLENYGKVAEPNKIINWAYNEPNLVGTLATALANSNAEEQRAMLGEELYPLVLLLEHDMAPKVTGMLLELDQTMILHLLESPEALKSKVAEAMEVLRNFAQQEQSTSSTADQLASLSGP